ncbi:HAD domain-containing protein [Ralstonia pickettii]|uniref:HAD domain-containing protein n=1 Tax=Ralstonia pickettii TaxID=329 RepID=UPI0029C9DDAA|nr:HAD domain-containing protein [Ralstonia pickettii]
MPESRVLFLDFDGVLHAVDEPPLNGGGRLMANPRLFAWRPVLEDILAPYPKVRIIVSSDWRRLLDDDNLKRALGPLAPRFTGVVERWCASRVDEILTKARRRKLTTWLAELRGTGSARRHRERKPVLRVRSGSGSASSIRR